MACIFQLGHFAPLIPRQSSSRGIPVADGVFSPRLIRSLCILNRTEMKSVACLRKEIFEMWWLERERAISDWWDSFRRYLDLGPSPCNLASSKSTSSGVKGASNLIVTFFSVPVLPSTSRTSISLPPWSRLNWFRNSSRAASEFLRSAVVAAWRGSYLNSIWNNGGGSILGRPPWTWACTAVRGF